MLAKDGLGVNDDDIIWDSEMIEQQCDLINQLNEELRRVEELTKLINRREEALSMKLSDFPELYHLKQEIKPAVQLWETITQYNTHIQKWKEKKIAKMTLDEIEDFIQEW